MVQTLRSRLFAVTIHNPRQSLEADSKQHVLRPTELGSFKWLRLEEFVEKRRERNMVAQPRSSGSLLEYFAQLGLNTAVAAISRAGYNLYPSVDRIGWTNPPIVSTW